MLLFSTLTTNSELVVLFFFFGYEKGTKNGLRRLLGRKTKNQQDFFYQVSTLVV
jgi:hypothetical protein